MASLPEQCSNILHRHLMGKHFKHIDFGADYQVSNFARLFLMEKSLSETHYRVSLAPIQRQIVIPKNKLIERLPLRKENSPVYEFDAEIKYMENVAVDLIMEEAQFETDRMFLLRSIQAELEHALLHDHSLVPSDIYCTTGARATTPTTLDIEAMRREFEEQNFSNLMPSMLNPFEFTAREAAEGMRRLGRVGLNVAEAAANLRSNWPDSEAEEKAKKLLKGVISEGDFELYEKYGSLNVRGKDCNYVVPQHGFIKRYTASEITEFCAHIDNNCQCPPTDNVLALKLLIEGDEEHFLSVANHISTMQI